MSRPILPVAFEGANASPGAAAYLEDPAARRLVAFFEAKGLEALVAEDQSEAWYADWIAYQAEHGLYAGLLCAKAYSSRGAEFDLFKLTRFMEVFAYLSPAHGYSLQVSFLGIFPFWMSANEALKKEAAAALEKGGLFAFGVSEKAHGSDLYGNETVVRRTKPGRYRADGAKFYIGNSNAAAMIAVLAAKESSEKSRKRKPFVFFALRPGASGMSPAKKIRTMGIKTAFVGGFEIEDHELSEADVLSEGRGAWEAVFGTVALGKFFLGFGAIGICERAFHEALAHARGRVLYGKPAADMPHLRSAFVHAYAKLAAMKLYAYRALDYLRCAHAKDRRYQLWNCVQKAKVGTEGIEVVRLLSECIGAKAFESEGRFESALRDIQLIPGLEGSTHINFGVAAQFLKNYLLTPVDLPEPGSLTGGTLAPGENPYLMAAETGSFHAVRFADPLKACRRLGPLPNVGLFARQVKALASLGSGLPETLKEDAEAMIAFGKCLACAAYGQLIAENAALLKVPEALVSVIFHQLVEDLSLQALKFAALPQLDRHHAAAAHRLVHSPRTAPADVAAVSELLRAP